MSGNSRFSEKKIRAFKSNKHKWDRCEEQYTKPTELKYTKMTRESLGHLFLKKKVCLSSYQCPRVFISVVPAANSLESPNFLFKYSRDSFHFHFSWSAKTPPFLPLIHSLYYSPPRHTQMTATATSYLNVFSLNRICQLGSVFEERGQFILLRQCQPIFFTFYKTMVLHKKEAWCWTLLLAVQTQHLSKILWQIRNCTVW